MITTPSASRSNEWTFRRVVWATLLCVSVAMCFWLLYRFYQVVFILFVAVMLGTVIRPIANWLYQRGISRIGGVILIYAFLLVLISGFLWLLFPLIFQQAATIAREAPTYYQNVRNGFVNSPSQFFALWGRLFPPTLPPLSPAPASSEDVVVSAGQVLQYGALVAKIIFTVIVVLILTLYWALDGPRIIRSILLLVPQTRRESISDLVAAMEAKVGYYIAGQAVLCLVIGVLALILYVLIGLPNAFVLAIAAGVLEAVPMLGPVLGAVPASLMALSIDPSKLMWVILGTIVIQQAENSLLVPRIMKRTVGVNPFVTLLALFAFGELFGIAGALMAIPMAAIIQLALNHFVFQTPVVEMEPSEGRDYTSRLRYEAQDLIQDLRKQVRHQKRGSDQKILQIEQVMDEIETITTNLDTLLAEVSGVDEE